MTSPRHRALWLALVTVAVLAPSCGPSPITGPPVTTTTTTAAPSSPCPFGFDTVGSATDSVQLQARGAPQAVDLRSGISAAPLSCGIVRARAGGTANVRFSHDAMCQFQQDPQSTKVAVMRTREPDGALLRLGLGQVLCTTAKAGQRISLCGMGDIQPDGTVNQLLAVCNPDPSFTVAVFGGSAQITDPNGRTQKLAANKQFTFFDFPGATTPPGATPTADAKLTEDQISVLASQARSLNVRVKLPSATTTTTSTTTTLPPIR